MDVANPSMSPGEAEAMLAVVMGFLAIAMVVVLVIQVVICWLLMICFQRIPAQFRLMAPGMVWLLLIPCFNLVWNFFVYLRLSKSYQAYFTSVNRTDVGDCGRSLGLAYAICVACSIIPLINYLAGPASLVLLIIYLVKAFNLRGKIAAA